MSESAGEFAGKHVLIIIENLPAPFDRRVWQEATTLRQACADVSIICPKMKGFTDSHEIIDGIEIHRHSLPVEGRGAIGYLTEYTVAFLWQTLLAYRIYRKKPFDVIQGCNPPDLIFAIALPYRWLGVRYLFDHHDINPELYIAKFGKKGLGYRLMLWAERITFRTAHRSIATNESYRQIAIDRGGMHPALVDVVRSGPSLDRLKIQPPDDSCRKGRKFLVGYIGVIGVQEGLDLLLESVQHVVATRQDIQFAIVGGGTALAEVQALAEEMRLTQYVDFYGRVSDQDMLRVLNSCDLCVNPDRPTEMNNLSTMNKIMEYMALGKPIVQYDLKEGRASAQEASLYATNTSTQDFANKIIQLLDDPITRQRMGEFGRQRVVNELSWSHEKERLLAVYRSILGVKKDRTLPRTE